MSLDWTKVKPGKTVVVSPEGVPFLFVYQHDGYVWLRRESDACHHTYPKVYLEQRWTIREEWERCTEEFELTVDYRGFVYVVRRDDQTPLIGADLQEKRPYKLDGMEIWRRKG